MHHAEQTKASQENSHRMQPQTFYLELSIMVTLFFFNNGGWTQLHALYNPQTLENFGYGARARAVQSSPLLQQGYLWTNFNQNTSLSK